MIAEVNGARLPGHLPELEINPLKMLSSGQGVNAVGALALLRGASVGQIDPKVA